jgi:hypothetical protein
MAGGWLSSRDLRRLREELIRRDDAGVGAAHRREDRVERQGQSTSGIRSLPLVAKPYVPGPQTFRARTR